MTRNLTISKSVCEEVEKRNGKCYVRNCERNVEQNWKLTFVMWSGTSQCGQTANNMLRMKNGLQQSTNVKNTSPKTWWFQGKFRAWKNKWKIELNSLECEARLSQQAKADSLMNLPWSLSARWLQRSQINLCVFAGSESPVWNSMTASAHCWSLSLTSAIYGDAFHVRYFRVFGCSCHVSAHLAMTTRRDYAYCCC